MCRAAELPGIDCFESATSGPEMEPDGTHLCATHIPVSFGDENADRQQFANI
jgi:hypothetical protein